MGNQLQPVSQPKSFITVKYGKGFFHLSEREKLLCDTWLRSRSFTECARAFQAKYKKPIAPGTIKVWFSKKKHLKDYLAEQLTNAAEANITKDDYVARIRRLAEGDVPVNKTTPFFYKLLGDAKGFLHQEDRGMQQNIQIVLKDGNGEG